MTRREVLERLCRLQEEVATYLRHRHPSDCFCGTGGMWPRGATDDDYRNDGAVLGFIEQAVRERLVAAEAAFPATDRDDIADQLEALAARVRQPSAERTAA